MNSNFDFRDSVNVWDDRSVNHSIGDDACNTTGRILGFVAAILTAAWFIMIAGSL